MELASRYASNVDHSTDSKSLSYRPVMSKYDAASCLRNRMDSTL
ncbi:hypothetical protein RMSM_06583 [Rhodopirellula maiorica SM1]|uniref:Uncharacterized protein n=1 Tax=Rhodopirellula maiorica SM1 TaxID=1265738 RepID=M5RR94_9BACT|nr:hypothetical protein RMSM_06583 [Rhodopirellula maiorica SM1]